MFYLQIVIAVFNHIYKSHLLERISIEEKKSVNDSERKRKEDYLGKIVCIVYQEQKKEKRRVLKISNMITSR